MKITHITIAALASASLLLSSCVVTPVNGYSNLSFSTDGHGVSVGASVGWTSASYDVNGFPIYGYYNGRPVYGYTAAGAAVFTIAALTALCFVPNWGPAPWYCGHWHYPAHIHRVAAPPRVCHGHYPTRRPAGGLHAPIHHHGPSHGVANRPSHSPNHGVANRPSHTPNHGTINRPSHSSRPNISVPRTPSMNRVPGSSRPAGFSRGNSPSRSFGSGNSRGGGRRH